MMDPLEELVSALLSGESAPPFEWVVAYCSDGTLDHAWNASANARWLVWVYGYTGDVSGLVLATCACARKAGARGKAKRLVTTLEQWALRAASKHQVDMASLAVESENPTIETTEDAVAVLSDVVLNEMNGAKAGKKAADAIHSLAVAIATAKGELSRVDVLKDLADVFRAALRKHGRAVPTLAQLFQRSP